MKVIIKGLLCNHMLILLKPCRKVMYVHVYYVCLSLYMSVSPTHSHTNAQCLLLPLQVHHSKLAKEELAAFGTFMSAQLVRICMYMHVCLSLSSPPLLSYTHNPPSLPLLQTPQLCAITAVVEKHERENCSLTQALR